MIMNGLIHSKEKNVAVRNAHNRAPQDGGSSRRAAFQEGNDSANAVLQRIAQTPLRHVRQSEIMTLQRAVGNRAVQALVQEKAMTESPRPEPSGRARPSSRGEDHDNVIQRSPALPDGAFPLCTATPARPHDGPPDMGKWYSNATLVAIRAEQPGENKTLLSRGRASSGEAVALVQQAVLSWGCKVKGLNLLPKFGADADFGSETDNAVRKYQVGVGGLNEDGVVGPLTLKTLDTYLGGAAPVPGPTPPGQTPAPPGSSPGPAPPGAAPSVKTQDCDPADIALIQRAHNRAIEILNKAIARLTATPVSATTKTHFYNHFGTYSNWKRNVVVSHFRRDRRLLIGNSMQYECEAVCESGEPAYTYWVFGDIHICLPWLRSTCPAIPNECGETFIHEIHHWDGSRGHFDLKYHVNNFDNDATWIISVNNADAYSELAQDLYEQP